MESYTFFQGIDITNVIDAAPAKCEGEEIKPLLLLSTALAKHYQTTGQTPGNIEAKMEEYFSYIVQEQVV